MQVCNNCDNALRPLTADDKAFRTQSTDRNSVLFCSDGEMFRKTRQGSHGFVLAGVDDGGVREVRSARTNC